MRFLKLLTIPAVLLLSVALAVPASAHALNQATVAIGCGSGSQAGQVCVTLTGDLEQGNDVRYVFFDVYAQGSQTSLGEISIKLPAFDPKNTNNDNHVNQTVCFPAITGSNASSFTVKITKVTADAAGQQFSDLTIHLPNENDVSYTKDNQSVESPKVTPVGNTDKCVVPSPSPSASPATTVALASTGGFDFRFPLIGLVVLVAGGALFLVSASRGRTGAR